MKCKLSILLLFLFTKFALGQEQNIAVKELKVGDTIPSSLFLGKMINYPSQSVKMSDLKEDLIILDFWATWCSPCVAFFKEAEKLEKEFEGKILIVPVTGQTEAAASSFFKDMQKIKGFLPRSIVEDKMLHSLFPHNLIPHEVWIDKKRIVKAITSSDEVNAINIRKYLNDGNINLEVKKDVKMKEIDNDRPTLMTNADQDNALLYYSVVKKYQEDLGSMISPQKDFVLITNSTVLDLFKYAFGKGYFEFTPNNRSILNVKQPLAIQFGGGSDMKKWDEFKWDHLYSYEFYARDTAIQSHKFDIMQSDLNNYFRVKMGIEAKVEKRKVMCWSLERTSKIDKIKTKGIYAPVDDNRYKLKMENHLLVDLMNRLQAYYQQFSPIPLLDNTGYEGKVDLELNCDLSADMSVINAELKKYDLAFIKKEQILDMIVVSDVKKAGNAK